MQGSCIVAARRVSYLEVNTPPKNVKVKLRFRVKGLDLPARRKRCSGGGRRTDMPSGNNAEESSTHTVGESELYKEERNVLEMHM